MKFIIRNDDVAYDTTLDEIRTFCEICDKYGVKIIQAITPIGEVQKIRTARMSNEKIKSLSQKCFWENKELMDFLYKRNDFIGVHGLWHTHKPNDDDIRIASGILGYFGMIPHYFVPPFNEGVYKERECGLKVCQLSREKGDCLEDFLESGTPTSPIMYLHSWRFKRKPHTFKQLDECLKRLA